MKKQEEGKGILYIAQNRDSFKKLYEEVKRDIFMPALKNLPSQKEVKKLIKKGLEAKP